MSKTEPYNLRYDPGPVTLDFLKDKESRAVLLIGPFGTGKTTGAAFKKIMLQSKWVKPDRKGKQRTRFAIVRNTYPQLRDTTIKTYLDWFPPGEFGGRYLAADKIATYRIQDREIELVFRALDDDNDVRNLLSLELSGAHIDEAREIKHSIFKGILGRVGRYPSKKDYDGGESADFSPFLCAPCVDLTTNYPNRDHWLYGDFVSKPVSGYRMYEQGQGENKHNLPPNYYENLELDYANRPDLLKTLVRGEWGITYIGKLVYPEWETKDGAPNPFKSNKPLAFDSTREFQRGWDNTGLHPGCVITQLTPDLQWRVFKEFWQDDVGITDFCEMVDIWCNDNLHGAKFKDIGDPAGKTRASDPNKMSPVEWMKKYFRSVGRPFNYQEGIQTFKIRRESVAGRMIVKRGEPLILVDPSCTLVLDGFEGGYCYKEIGNSGIYRDAPEKNKYADVHDALQYIATRLFTRNVNRESHKIDFREVFMR